MSWATVAEALELWPTPGQAPDPATLQRLLDASTERLEPFAPAVDDIPARYRHANVLDAHELWTWARDTGQDTGGTFDPPLQFTAPRTSTQVRSLLRPTRPAMLR